MSFPPLPAGYYYILTGGNTVHLYRTEDFVSWNESSPSPFSQWQEYLCVYVPRIELPLVPHRSLTIG